MELKIDPIEIPEDDPFRNDQLERKESAVILTQLISNIRKPFVLSIDSSWGTGKTTFVKMWRQHLMNEGYPTLYFSAWENDFSDSPMVALLAELELALEELPLNKTGKQKVKTAFRKAKKHGVALAKLSLPIAVRLGTMGLIDNEKINEAISEHAEKIALDLIKKYESDKKSIKIFKNKLGEFVTTLSTSKSKKPQESLILFIDELDRCRPDYALELMEKAKHLFDVPGIIFILSLDKKQVGYSIKTMYGSEMDTNGYLERFIDLDYRLPQPSMDLYSKYLFSRYGFENYNAFPKDFDYQSIIYEGFSALGYALVLSLRQLERCYTLFTLVIRTTHPTHNTYPYLLIGLIVLKISNNDLYLKLISKEAKANDIFEYIGKNSAGSRFLENRIGLKFMAMVIASEYTKETAPEGIDKYHKIAIDTSRPSHEITQAGIVADILSYDKMQNDFDYLEYLDAKLSIASRFLDSQEE